MWGLLPILAGKGNSLPSKRSCVPKEFTMASKDHSRYPSPKLQAADAAIIKKRIQKGEFLNRIAADFDVNPGRISEIKAGKTFAKVLPAP